MSARSACRVAIAFALAIIVGSCAQRPVPTMRSPSPTATTGPDTVVFIAQLYAHTLLPGGPAADAERACAGVATVTIDPTPRGVFSTAVARFEISLTGCPPGTVLTNAFLSRPEAGEGEHFDDMWIGAGLGESLVASGSGVFRSINEGVPRSRAEAVIATPTDFGIRLMSRNNPFGFLTGQLRPR